MSELFDVWDQDTTAYVAAMAQAVTALVAIAAAWFAWRQVREARRAREAQSQPFVVVDIVPGRVWANWLMLVIENLGHTLAKDVRITFDPPIATTVKDNPLAESILIREGVPSLPPGRRIETLFDVSHDRKDQALPLRHAVVVRFKDYRGREQEPLEYVIDLSHLYEVDMLTDKTLNDVVAEMKKIRVELEHWRDGERGLFVRRPSDNRRERNEERWQMALTDKRRSVAHPGLKFGFTWPARIALIREPWYAWRERKRHRQRSATPNR